MRVRIKPLRGSEFFVEDVDLKLTPVGDIKEKIHAVKGDEYPVDTLKLIHLGRVLSDDKFLADYDFKDDGFLVCMLAKKKKPKQEAVQAKPTAQTTTQSVNQTQATQNPRPIQTTQNVQNAAQNVQTNENVQNQFVQEEVVQNLVAMGFNQQEVEQALIAAFGNPDRAYEFLSNPEMMVAIQQQQQQRRQAQATGSAQNVNQNMAQNLEQFRNTEEFQRLRAQLMENPAAMEEVLGQMAVANPGLFQQITATEESLRDFVEFLLNADDNAGGSTTGGQTQTQNQPNRMNPFGNMGQTQSTGNAGQNLGSMGNFSPEMMTQALEQLRNLPEEQRNAIMQQFGLDPQMMERILQLGNLNPQQQAPRIQLTPEEVAAVNRLSELGFSRRACLEAYLACDKDEQLAANYLFTNPPEEEENELGNQNDDNQQLPPPQRNPNDGNDDADDNDL